MSFLESTLGSVGEFKAHKKRLSNGVVLDYSGLGILKVAPVKAGEHRVVISSGIHGNETAPMEIVDALVQEIESEALPVGNELLFIIGNPDAAIAEQRFVEENLNRLFSGKHQHSQSLEARRAADIEHVVGEFYEQGDEARLHYDLHTAIRGSQIEKFAVYPFLHDREWSLPQLSFLERSDIEAVLFSIQPSGTFSYFTSNSFAADSFTIELGKVRKFGDNDMQNFKDMIAGLRGVISGAEKFQAKPTEIKLFSVVEEVIKKTEDFKLHIEDDAKNFTEFEPGVVLASDLDYEYRTKQQGERFVFPISNVPCGQRAMLVVAPTKLW